MTLPIALQTYSVRAEMANDFERTINRLAEIGYPALEITYNIPGTTLDSAQRAFSDLGFQLPAAHAPLPLGEDRSGVLDFADMFGIASLVYTPGPKEFESLASIRRLCGRINDAWEVAADQGIALGYHNHWWEFWQVENQLAFDVMLENLNPGVFFEIDTYWVKTAGHDPAKLAAKLGDRAPLLHIKDGPANTDDDMVPVGQGVMDFPSILNAASGARWLIVELDRCGTDMLQAVEESYRYLVGEGLARGK